MTNLLLKSLAPQSVKVYRTLDGRESMNAKEIADELNVLPHAIYRSVKQLLELGFVEEISTYPVSFRAKSPDDAMNLYSMMIQENFKSAFAVNKTNNKPLDISFIQTRSQLIEMTNADVEKAQKSIDFIVSGHEVPAETILAHKRAVERGVEIRKLVQNLDAVNKDMFRNWKKAGVKVKYFPYMESRIFVYDSQIVYFTSYNPDKNEEALGVRFNYAPFARMMNEMFEKRWKLAEEV